MDIGIGNRVGDGSAELSGVVMVCQDDGCRRGGSNRAYQEYGQDKERGSCQDS